MVIELNAAQRIMASNLAQALISHGYKLPLFEVKIDNVRGKVWAQQSTSQVRSGAVSIMLKMQNEPQIRIGAYTDSARRTVQDLKDYVHDELIESSTIVKSL